MNPSRDHRDRLLDICQAAQKALEFVQGIDYETFVGDDRTVFAVVRALEIVGEAAKKVPQDVRNLHPGVPWRSMAGIRDKLIHDYVSVDLEVVWKTVMEDLPPLLPLIQHVRDQLPE
jgi:uncharacterized protein with HEPN domain